jgi:N-acetylgalactosamine-N,N'-diacetylbacillosaminyl-diphospho-undecaprenol 4-alpha-N-acetylgalactosaminyltransferase
MWAVTPYYGCMSVNRILILSNALSGGGAESVARLMAQRLEGAACVLFENDAGVAIPGCQFWVAARKYQGGLVVTLMANLWRLAVIQWVKLKLRPTITISHLEGPNFANMLTILGGERVLFVHNRIRKSYSGNTFREHLKRRLVGILYNRADRVVGVSPEVCDELSNFYKVQSRKAVFLPNPIDRTAISKDSDRKYDDFQEQVLSNEYLISVASLTPKKNHELLLRVFQRLVYENQQFSSLKLLLLGEGELRDSLQRLCRDLDLSVFDARRDSFTGEENVYFLGYQARPYRLLRRAKLLLMTSSWEGLPIALLEAMSLGLPAVISDCSEGIRSAWQTSGKKSVCTQTPTCCWTSFGALINGLVPELDTIDIWVSAIKRLLNDKELYESCSSSCKERSADYDINRIVDIWQQKLLTADR